MSEPVSVRDQIAAGPRFVGALEGTCGACADRALAIDVATGLCRPCWRAWRWSPRREEGLAGRPAHQNAGAPLPRECGCDKESWALCSKRLAEENGCQCFCHVRAELTDVPPPYRGRR